MVSKARLDLPDPESPVRTTSRSRGISSEMFFRLCTRAPCTAIVVRGAARGARVTGRAGLARTMTLLDMEERELLHAESAPLGQANGQRCLADDAQIREVLAGDGDTLHIA